MTGNFKSEENEILEIFLDEYIFNKKNSFQNLNRLNDSCLTYGPPNPSEGMGIELIVRPECNQSCEYCYIHQYGKELYPIEERVDNETILNNLKIFLNYVFNERKIFISRWELFSGDLFYDGLIFDILDVFYDILKPLYQTYKQLFLRNPVFITGPFNFSFAQKADQVNKMYQYILRFKEIGCVIGLSCSTDGRYAVDSREKIITDDIYWDNLFSAVKLLEAGMHPMISSENIDNYIQNYDWWIESYKKYFGDRIAAGGDFQPMFLEVRNDTWTPDKINAYLALLDHMIEVRLEMCDNNIELLAYHLFNGDGAEGSLKKLIQHDPLVLDWKDAHSQDRLGCSIQGLLHVQLNNLNIIPCHRTSYKIFTAGHFTIDNNHIIGVEAYNPSPLLSILFMKNSLAPKCSICPYSTVCMQGCLGAQYESTGEIFQPCPTVCDFMMARINYLIKRYDEMGVLKSAFKQGLINDEFKQTILKLQAEDL